MKQRCYLNIVLLIFIIGLIVNLVISQIGQCPKHPCEDIIYCTSKEIADSSYNCGLPCSMNLIFEGLWDWCCNALSVWVDTLEGWKVWEGEFKGIIVVRDKEVKVKEVWERNGWKVSVIADEGGEISERLNAFFSPRAYGFSKGKLVWVQKRVGMGIVEVLEEFLREVKGSEKAIELMNKWSAEMRERFWGKAAVFELKGSDKR